MHLAGVALGLRAGHVLDVRERQQLAGFGRVEEVACLDLALVA